MSARDRNQERAFLAGVGPQAFADVITARLDAQDPEFGDSFAWMALTAFWRELGDEAIDLAAWATLLARRYELERIQPERLHQIRGALIAAAHHARQAHDILTEAQRVALAESAP